MYGFCRENPVRPNHEEARYQRTGSGDGREGVHSGLRLSPGAPRAEARLTEAGGQQRD